MSLNDTTNNNNVPSGRILSRLMNTTTFTRWTLVTASCVALSLGALSSCKDNDDAYDSPAFSISESIKISNGATEVGATESTAVLHIRSNRAWSASSALDWISITPSEGAAGDHDVTIHVLKNPAGASRAGQVAFRAGGITLFYTVQQQGDGSISVKPSDNNGNNNNGNNNNSGQLSVVDSKALEAFLTKYDKGVDMEKTTITEDETFTAVVISSSTGNFSNKNVVLQAGEVGINVRTPQALDRTLQPGAVVTVSAKGASVQHYGKGSFQLELTDQSALKATGELSAIQPKAVTLADIYAGKYDNILVAVDGVQFTKPGSALYSGTAANGKKAPMYYFNRLTDCATATPANVDALSVAISTYSSFKAEVASDKNGRIVGVLQSSTTGTTKHYNLYPRSMQDLAGLTGNRCTEGTAPTPTPNPTPTPTPTPAPAEGTPDLMIIDYVEGAAGNEKYLQLYNPTDAEIDLSQYNIYMKNFGKDNQPSQGKYVDHTFSLTGKLGAKQTIVIRHNFAKAYSEGVADAGLSFDGNDPIALRKGEQVIDFIGLDLNSPWIDGKGFLGSDRFMHRKVDVVAPSRTFIADQWEVTALTRANQAATFADLFAKYFGKR